ncbi:MAG: helix-turn-helix transcriptional regulator [Ruminococcaceae bacterium]|nr:helix-turn-helix transcriptional regulator [Oscillospiraceae bacterium]
MELHKKLQELRKDRGLTQEELAEELFVSRTAISKWESGRGLPSIDSLKEISKFFSVSIDSLLSGEKLLSLAEREHQSKVRKMRDFLLGLVDLFAIMLIVLPLYPNATNGHIYSVVLFSYTGLSHSSLWIHWGMFSVLILVGILKITLTHFNIAKGQAILTTTSLVLSIVCVFLLGFTREPYALSIIFTLLVIKGILLYSMHQ